MTELWQVLTGAAPGRRHADEITIFDSVGFAVEDFSALRFLQGQLSSIGAPHLDLVPDLADPRDLFGLLGSAEGLRVPRREAVLA